MNTTREGEGAGSAASSTARSGTRPLGNLRRVVVKLGTQVITHPDGTFALGRLTGIIEDVAWAVRAGQQIVLVSSGAVGLGVATLGLSERPRSLGLRQACAAVGQGRLFATYAQGFGVFGLVAAQVLLTDQDLGDADRALSLRTTLLRLLELGTVPVLNENDSVSVREIVDWRRRQSADASGPSEASPAAFADNDGLAARVAAALDADLLVLMTDVAGVYDRDPRTNPNARLLDTLEVIDDAALAMAGGTSRGGTGGMTSKLAAARHASHAGVHVIIAPGHEPGALVRVLAGQTLGTFVPSRMPGRTRRRTLAHGRRVAGAVVVDDGAVAALRARNASLLPVGVLEVHGHFGVGALLEIRDGSGRVIGHGLSNYDSAACRAIAGHRSDDVLGILGYVGYDAIITRDNLVLAEV